MKFSLFPIVLLFILANSSAWALDTLEPFSLGLSDAELYVGVDHLGGTQNEQLYYFAGGVGAGITERLSLFAGYTAEATGRLSDSAHFSDVSLYGNVGEWNPVSVDAGLRLAEGQGSMQVNPFIEVNWDFAPNQALAGFYTHGGPIAAGVGPAVDWSWEQGIGGYYTVGEGKQLFCEWVTGYDLGRNPPTRAWQRGALLGGLNWGIADSLELITEAGTTIPQSDGRWRFQGSVGFVATLPEPR